MNLVELFDELSVPSQGIENVFNAIPIPDYPNFRIAIDIQGNPVLLLAVSDSKKGTRLKNLRLKHLELVKNVRCKITENSHTTFQNFTVITFKSLDRYLQDYFLRISETLIKSLNTNPTQQQVFETLNKFVEVFRALNDAPTNTVQGLWAELFLIDFANDTKSLITYWHNFPEEKFDFNAGIEKIEVKSSSSLERIHYFSSEQLNPPKATQVLIASIFVKQNKHGRSIQQIIESIIPKILDEKDLVEKLHLLVSKTLGNSLEQSININFDEELARNSIQFYNSQDIKKIQEVHIPSEVTNLKYKSDLSEITSTHISEFKLFGILF